MATINEQNLSNTKKEHILVGLSPSPSNEKIINTAHKMAQAFNGILTAIYVITSSSKNMSQEDKKRLQKNVELAERLGATIVTLNGDNVPFHISEYARLSNVTKIVIGKSTINPRGLIKKQSLVDQLMSAVSNVDIYIIPDKNADYKKDKLIIKKDKIVPSFKDILITLIVLVIETLIGYLFLKIGFTESNIIIVYILGVLITSIITKNKICWIFSSILSVMLFNFIFTFPHFSLMAYGEGYPVTFVVMLIVSLITGSISNKMKDQVKKSTDSAYRTKILFDSNQLIQSAESDKQIIKITIEQINKLLNRKTFIYFLKDKSFYFSELQSNQNEIKNKENIIEFVLEQNTKAGSGTANFNKDDYLYIPLSINKKMFGVVGIEIDKEPIEPLENSILNSIIGECSLALENYFNYKEKEMTEIMAKNEQVRANLLRAISHDLRTPLTSISGNADNLLANGHNIDDISKTQMYKEIYEDSIWLINLVENLLSVTKFEDGNIKLNYTTELVEDVINEALKHIHRNKIKHNIIFKNSEDFILIKVDVRLIVQVFINIIDNAIKYTPEGSTIEICVAKEGLKAIIQISDNGPGINDKEKVFEMFYTGGNKIADSRKSLGLGLPLCKLILNAHNCEIKVSDNKPQGTIFTFTLPIEEVDIHE